MFEKVTVCHLLPQRAGAGDKAVAGKEGNWHGLVSGERSRLCRRKATARSGVRESNLQRKDRVGREGRVAL